MAYRGGRGLRRGGGGAGWKRPFRSAPGSSSSGRSMSGDQSKHSHAITLAGSGPPSAEQSRTKHPPHLKGREIGMWYASRGSSTRGLKDRSGEVRQRVQMNDRKAQEIEALLAANQLNDGDAAMSFTNVQSSFQRTYVQHKLDSIAKECAGGTLDMNRPSIESTMLVRDEALDVRLRRHLEDKRRSGRYCKMLDFRQRLPAYEKSEDILRIVGANQVVVISGETGCGKTTQVPQFILDENIRSGSGSKCHIICTQPRRISATSVAERIAQERDETCGGESVGYHIRLESKMPRSQGSMLFCTTGTVLKYLESDPRLMRASHVIIDEIHERDLQSDFLLMIMKDLLQCRSDLKLILMSATLNAEKFSKYFGNCAVLNIPGFTYPVKEYYLEDVLEHTNYRSGPRMKTRRDNGRRQMSQSAKEYEALKPCFLRTLHGKYSRQTIDSLNNYNEDEIDLNLMKSLIELICRRRSEGAILVFLPGWTDISALNKLLVEDMYFTCGLHLILPLHSMMPSINQREIFDRPPTGVRKIILSTNIAETSITVDDVVYVIDCGKIKITNFDVGNNIATLTPEWVSLANAHQRRGRAGRVQPGICYHLYTKLRENVLEAYQLPEIMRTRLEELCLHIKMLKLGKIEPFMSKAIDPPSPEAVNLALKTLTTMNALDSWENLTPLGYHLGKLPVDPQTGKMLLFGAIFSCLSPILTVTASLSFKDAFVIPLGKEKQADEQRYRLSQNSKSDHIAFINAYDGWEDVHGSGSERHYCFQNFLSSNTLSMLHKMKGQLADHLYDVKLIASRNPTHPASNKNSYNLKLVKAVICAGLYPNVAKLNILNQTPGAPRKQSHMRSNSASTQEDGRVSLHLKSVNALEGYFESPWLVYHRKIKSTNQISLHDSTMIPAYPLIFFGGKVESDGKSDTIIVDDFIKFHCAKKTANLIQKLRKELDGLLDYKISHPGCTNWDPSTSEGALMKAIVELIQSEEILSDAFYDDKSNKKKCKADTNRSRW